MFRIVSLLVLISVGSNAFSELPLEAQKKKLMDQIVAAKDPAVRKKLQAIYETAAQQENEIYVDCILENMKGVVNDFAVKAVDSACRLKQEAQVSLESSENETSVEPKLNSPTHSGGSKERPINDVGLAGRLVSTEPVKTYKKYELTVEDKLYLSKLDEQILKQENSWRQSGRLIEDSKILSFVESVLARITSGVEAADFIDFRVSIFDSPDFHRSHTANGQIFLSSGLLVSLGGESDLARVLAHQVAGIQLFHDLSVKDVEGKLTDIVKLRPDYIFVQSQTGRTLGNVTGTAFNDVFAGAVAGALVTGAFNLAENRRSEAEWKIRQRKEIDARELATKYLIASGFQNLEPVIGFDFKTGSPDVKGSTLDSRVHAIFPKGVIPDSLAQQAAVKTEFDPRYKALIWSLIENTVIWAADHQFPHYLLAIAEGNEERFRVDASLSLLMGDAYLELLGLENIQRAETWFLTSAKLNSDNPLLLHRLGEVYYLSNDPRRAARAFIQYLKTGDTSVDRELILEKLRVLKRQLASGEAKVG